MISTGSPFCFLSSVFSFLHLSNACNILNIFEDYIIKLQRSKEFHHVDNFYAREELHFLCELLTTHADVAERITLCSRLVPCVACCCEKLFDKLLRVIFISVGFDENSEMYATLRSYFVGKAEFPLETPKVEEASNTCEMETNVNDSCNKKRKVRFDENSMKETKKDEGEKNHCIEFARWDEYYVKKFWTFLPLVRLHKFLRSKDITTAGIVIDYKKIVHDIEMCLILNNKLMQVSDFFVSNVQDFVAVYISVCRVFMLGELKNMFLEKPHILLKDLLFYRFSGVF